MARIYLQLRKTLLLIHSVSLQAGLNAHLSKPVDPDLLFETMEHMIKP